MCASTESMKTRWRLTFSILALLALGTAGCGWYLITKPQRDANRALSLLRKVQVGKTTMDELESMIADSGMRGTVEKRCAGDLERLVRHHETPGFPMQGHYLPSIPKQDLKCDYIVYVENNVLRKAHLAEPAFVSTGIVVRNRVVTATDLMSDLKVDDYSLHILLAQGIPDSPELVSCRKDICRIRKPALISIFLSESVPISERNRFLSINTSCFSVRGNCMMLHDLLPISETE